ncbi:hypothetical protein ACFL9T_17075, partial [Thermodesulfobacteriota bacterium]
MVGAVVLAAGDVDGTAVLQAGMLIAGGQVIINGINISQQAEINAAAIKELSESFESEMKPVVMDFEGKEVELTGSAEEQFQKWRDILRQIYYAETGFDPEESGKVTAPEKAPLPQ